MKEITNNNTTNHDFMKRPLSFQLRSVQIALIALFFLFTTLSYAQVSGTVWQDLPVNGAALNIYGVKDANELGVEGVTVTAYPGGVSTTTAADGTYTIPGVSGAVRVEFSGWPSHLQESPDGGGANTSVQFVTAPNASVNFGLHAPEDFSDVSNPPLVLASWTNGLHTGNTNPALYAFDYSLNGQSTDEFMNGHSEVPPVVDATFDEVGTVWGIASQMDMNRYFASSVVRRHADLADGTGFIYVIDKSAATGTLAHKFDLNGINTMDGGVIDLGSVCRGGGCENDPGNDGVAAHYELGGQNAPNYDIDGAAKVGKAAFGAIEMQPGTSTLWAVNLNQRSLITIDVSDPIATNLPGAVNQYLLSALPGLPNCTNGEIRPWALTFANGKGYLGIICDASSGVGADLEGYILSFDPNNITAGFTTVLNLPTLNFARLLYNFHFRPWTDDWNDFLAVNGLTRFSGAQPIISDLEFTPDGDMIIGVADRGAMQLGYLNYKLDVNSTDLVEGASAGDIYHACTFLGGYVLENGFFGCDYNFHPTNQGFDGQGEFYDDESADSTPESSEGGLALLKGSGVVAVSTLDPHPSGQTGGGASAFWSSHGVQFYNNVDGSISRYYGVNYTGNVPEFSKAAGIGDVEMLSAPAPVEIGNLVWGDTNGDGIQDAGEAGIQGVVVELQDAGGAQIATATTDANGHYIFSNDPNGTTTGSHIYNLPISANTAYKLVVSTSNAGHSLSTPNAGSKDIIDSDANPASGVADVLATDVPVLGANNHTFDFGYSICLPTRCGTVTAVKN